MTIFFPSVKWSRLTGVVAVEGIDRRDGGIDHVHASSKAAAKNNHVIFIFLNDLTELIEPGPLLKLCGEKKMDLSGLVRTCLEQFPQRRHIAT